MEAIIDKLSRELQSVNYQAQKLERTLALCRTVAADITQRRDDAERQIVALGIAPRHLITLQGQGML